MKKIIVSNQEFTAGTLKAQIEKQWQAAENGRWGRGTIYEVSQALMQADEELFYAGLPASKTATLRRAYEILRDGRLKNQ